MSHVDNKAIKIPTDHYVGFQKRQGDDVPLAFMTIDGTDKAAEKRKATVDAWAKGNTWQSHSKQATLAPKSLVNKPLSGFKMGRNISYGSGWDSRHDKWRLEDPRGFQLEISSGNLQQIMQLCTIEKGEILEQCIWGRLGQENILIPISSPVYTTATANTDRMNKKGTIKDAKPGSKLIFVNGDEGIYIGKTYASGYDYDYEYSKRNGYSDYEDKKITRTFKTFNEKTIHTYVLLDKDGKWSKIMMRDSLKLSEVVDGEDWTLEEACDKANEAVGLNKVYTDLPNKYNKARVLQFSPQPVNDWSNYEFFVKEIGSYKDYTEELNNERVSYSSYIVIKAPTGEFGFCHFYHYDKTQPLSVNDFRQPRKIDRDAFFKDFRIVRLSKEEEYETYQHSWNYNSAKIKKTRTVNDYLGVKGMNVDDIIFFKLKGRYTTFSGKVLERDHTEE